MTFLIHSDVGIVSMLNNKSVVLILLCGLDSDSPCNLVLLLLLLKANLFLNIEQLAFVSISQLDLNSISTSIIGFPYTLNILCI